MSVLTLAQVCGFRDRVTFSGTSDGLDGSAKLLLYRKGTISRSVMLPPGPPGTLQKNGHCMRDTCTLHSSHTITHVQARLNEGSDDSNSPRILCVGDAPDHQRILCRALLTNDEMIEDVLGRSGNVYVTGILWAW